jgi:hypothetical protein
MEQETSDVAVKLAAYADGPDLLRAALSGLREADLDAALTSESWTVRQYVHHVVDGDDLWKMCIKAALGEQGAAFSLQWYWDQPQDAWAESWVYGRRAIEASLALFAANRRHTVQLLRQVAGAWERSIVVRWPDGREQEVGAGWVVEMQTDHVLGHIEDIGQIREARGL